MFFVSVVSVWSAFTHCPIISAMFMQMSELLNVCVRSHLVYIWCMVSLFQLHCFIVIIIDGRMSGLAIQTWPYFIFYSSSWITCYMLTWITSNFYSIDQSMIVKWVSAIQLIDTVSHWSTCWPLTAVSYRCYVLPTLKWESTTCCCCWAATMNCQFCWPLSTACWQLTW